MGQAYKQARDSEERPLTALAVAKVGRLYAYLQEQPLRVDQEVTSSTLDLLPAVIAFKTDDFGGLDWPSNTSALVWASRLTALQNMKAPVWSLSGTLAGTGGGNVSG